ncbi:MAG: tetratricopeptide repeat protein [Acidobacteria bacterium]|nr:tetratricopeptide repeat protein [Acidobacteriota bacterium]
MSWFRGAAFGLAAIVCAAPAVAQGLSATRAYVEGRSGWEAIRAGRHQDAAAAFAAALDAEPRDPSLHLGAGLAAYLLGRPTVAQHSLERALELAPSLTAASLLLADITVQGERYCRRHPGVRVRAAARASREDGPGAA